MSATEAELRILRDGEPIADLDIQNTLKLMWQRWNEVFQTKLGHAGRSHVSELMTARNEWAHQKAFTNDDAYRVADTAARLLKMISAGDQALAVEAIGNELLRLRYEEDRKKSGHPTSVGRQSRGAGGIEPAPWCQGKAPRLVLLRCDRCTAG